MAQMGQMVHFQIGETVVGTIGNNTRLRFRVAQPNHKRGKFNNPTTTYYQIHILRYLQEAKFYH